MNSSQRLLLALVCCTVLTACGGADNTAHKRPPAQLTPDATGYFCGMIVAEHEGPKSQIVLANSTTAIWFTSVRDGIAFTRLPEETRPVNAFYVTPVDLGGWAHPETHAGHWIAAEDAWFVIESGKLGSMGAPEAIPFSTQQAAQAFASEHGGRIFRVSDIPEDYILGPGQAQAGSHTDQPETLSIVAFAGQTTMRMTLPRRWAASPPSYLQVNASSTP